MSAPEKPLDTLVREARRELTPHEHGPRADWSKIDERLFDRIETAHGRSGFERDQAAHVRLLSDASPRARRTWLAVGLVAAAASVAVVVHHGSTDVARRSSTSIEPSDTASLSKPASTTTSAGALASREGTGVVRVGGAPIEAGRALAVGDAIETENARALFVSGSESKHAVTWALETTSRVDVRRAESPLVLSLERGAVEAQVTPVPNGEAFAIDVGGLRIAVHGTHLRVARDGAHVTVDLTEGVVSIGTPPRSGSTYGTQVTAPAHVEIDLNVQGPDAIKVDRALSDVRAAERLTPTPQSSVTTANGLSAPGPGAAANATEEHGMALASARSVAEAVPERGPQGVVTSPPRQPTAPQRGADAHPEETIAVAVKACVVKHLKPADVRVTLSSKLSVRVGDDGLVTFARFDPPLAPAAQECAAVSIYKTRFAHAGTVEIPIEVAPSK